MSLKEICDEYIVNVEATGDFYVEGYEKYYCEPDLPSAHLLSQWCKDDLDFERKKDDRNFERSLERHFKETEWEHTRRASIFVWAAYFITIICVACMRTDFNVGLLDIKDKYYIDGIIVAGIPTLTYMSCIFLRNLWIAVLVFLGFIGFNVSFEEWIDHDFEKDL